MPALPVGCPEGDGSAPTRNPGPSRPSSPTSAISLPPNRLLCRYPDGSGLYALFRLPNKQRQIKGTCIFVHGCKHDPESWFYKSAKCPKCTGEREAQPTRSGWPPSRLQGRRGCAEQ